MILRPYQQTLDDQIHAEWRAGNRVVLVQLSTGGGKTALFASVLEKHDGFAAVLVHRDRLVEQISLTLARKGVRHDLIASDKTKRIIARKHVKKFGQCFYSPGARARVASVQTLVKAKGLEKWLSQVTLWVNDECFPAGTMIDGKPIETLRVGDIITAFNERAGAFEPRKIVRTFKNIAPKNMMRIAINEHHVLRCTAGHPFWTRRGWVEAAFLTTDDEVLIHDVSMHQLRNGDCRDNRITTVPSPQSGTNFLHEELRNDLSRGEYRPFPTEENFSGELLDLRETNTANGPSDRAVPNNGTGLLQQGLLKGLSVPNQFGDNGADEPQICVGAYDRTKPDGSRGNSREGQSFSQSEGAQTDQTRRERDGCSGRSDARNASFGLGLFGSGCNKNQDAERIGLPVLLQSGCGEYRPKTSHRSGRSVAFDSLGKGTGSEERSVSYWARLDSVAVYERTDSGNAGCGFDDGYVYNIEVEGLHTYVADGVVVHNCHHVLKENTWGTCVSKFTHPACHGLLVTATPGRPDGKGLGRHADGFADTMIEGPPMRWLIDEGYLCDYDVVCPPSDLIAREAPKGSDGDYTSTQRRDAERNSHIVGDVPAHYVKWASGKSGITFCGTIETATATVEAYRALGVSAELITGETDPTIRDDIFDRAEHGQLNQIVAVDVISEGVDIPALQVGSFARLTGSIITWLQQLGRLLRPIYAPGYDLETREGRLAAIAASNKPRALLLDHVGGFADPSLGPPDKPRIWTLDRREKRAAQEKDPNDIPLRVCTNPAIDCFKPYPRTHRACPYCGFEPQPAGRAAPEQVEGDLQMLDPAALDVLRGAVIDPTMSRGAFDAQQLAKGAQSAWLNRHWSSYVAAGTAQILLRASMDDWAGQLHAWGLADHEIQRAFWLGFGVDVLSAQALGEKEAIALKERIDCAVNGA